MGLLDAVAAFAPIVGGALGYSGAKESAKMSQASAREQMAFQERMSSTAYQRAADDLESAGLNRILALGSPASSPAGAMAQVPDFGSALASGLSAGSGAASTAIEAAKAPASIESLLAKAGIDRERFNQEVEKTQLWKTIRPILTDTASSYKDLVDTLAEIPAEIWKQNSARGLDMIEIIIENTFTNAPVGGPHTIMLEAGRRLIGEATN